MSPKAEFSLGKGFAGVTLEYSTCYALYLGMAIPYQVLFDTFATNLKRSPPALDCFQKLGLSSNIGLGYNARGWDRLQQCIIFPLRRQHDKIVGFYGYPINQATRDNLSDEQRFVSRRIGFYPRYTDPYTQRLLLTQDILDAARLWQIHSIWENYTVSACYGSRGLTQEQLTGISSLRALQEVILFFSGSRAGRALAQKVGKQLSKTRPGIRLTVVNVSTDETISTLSPSTLIKVLGERIIVDQQGSAAHGTSIDEKR